MNPRNLVASVIILTENVTIVSEKNTGIEIADLDALEGLAGVDLSLIGGFDLEVDSLDVMASKRGARFHGPLIKARQRHPDRTIFSHVSLEGWLAEARAAGLPMVDGEVVHRMPMLAILSIEEPRDEDSAQWAALEKVRAGLGANDMLRWDCCASMDVKSAMHHGTNAAGATNERGPLNGVPPAWRTVLDGQDPRFFDLAYVYPGEDIPIVKRPWVEARHEGGHPVEYRVFVQNGEVLGVANYYIQRDLPPTDQVKAEVEQAIAHTERLVQSMADRRAHAFNGPVEEIGPSYRPDQLSCTIDYLVAEDGRVLFLEAGPPFGLGAHPCAFMTNKIPDASARSTEGVIDVRGVALAMRKAPASLREFLEVKPKSSSPKSPKPG